MFSFHKKLTFKRSIESVVMVIGVLPLVSTSIMSMPSSVVIMKFINHLFPAFCGEDGTLILIDTHCA